MDTKVSAQMIKRNAQIKEEREESKRISLSYYNKERTKGTNK